MRRFLLNQFFISLLILLITFSLSFSAQALNPLHVIMHERLYTFSTHYDIDSDDSLTGSIVKTKLSLRTSYEYYDQEGESVSCAYLRIFSLGSLFTWAGVIDVYDAEDERIGLIEGSILTFLPSKFSFYNKENTLIGIAYMDADCMGFNICKSSNSIKSIAYFHRIFVHGITDYWTITIVDPQAIDIRMLLSFGAFAIDHQAKFREDN